MDYVRYIGTTLEGRLVKDCYYKVVNKEENVTTILNERGNYHKLSNHLLSFGEEKVMREKMQYLGHETHGLKNGAFYFVYYKDWKNKKVKLLNEYGEPEEVDWNLTQVKDPHIFLEEDVNLDGAQEEDIINKPDHYHSGGIDTWELVDRKYTQEMKEGWYAGNVQKYLMRYHRKGNPVQDLEKMVAYAKKLLMVVKERGQDDESRG